MNDMSDVDGWQDWRLVENPLVTSGVDGLPEPVAWQRKRLGNQPLPSGFSNIGWHEITQEEYEAQKDCHNHKRYFIYRELYAAQCRAKGAEGVAIGRIDEGDDGAFVELYPDRDLPLNAEVFLAPTKPAASGAIKDCNLKVVDEAMVELALQSGFSDYYELTGNERKNWRTYVSFDALDTFDMTRIMYAALTAALSQPATDQDIAEGKALDAAIDEHCEQQAGTFTRLPEMTDPMGRYWKQPVGLRDRVRIFEAHAAIDERDWLALSQYDTTNPSGTYTGKAWRRGELLCWYGAITDGRIAIESAHAVVHRTEQQAGSHAD